MAITGLFSDPFYFSRVAVATAEVPGRWHVGLAGVGYMVDLELSEGLTRGTDGFQHQSIPLIRQQADNSARPGESSLNPEDLWRRSAETWVGGAGQNYYDRSFSVDGMYHSSTGIDPSKPGQISLLPDTGVALASASSNVRLAVGGASLYAIDGTHLKYTNALAFPSTWVTVTGTPAAVPVSLCSDGTHVYVAYPSDIYTADVGGSAATVFHSAPLAGQTLVRYVKGRLLSAGDASVYDNGLPGTTAPTAWYTQPNADWTWVDITEGPNAIYLAGYAGDKSLIYQTAVKDDGTALDAPVVAGELPDGEVVRSLQGYLGFLLIGSTHGLRFAALDTTGSISTIGDLIPTDDPVLGFEPQDRYVWYCGSTDGGDASLGRVNLEFLNGTTPAYWNDLAVADSHVPATSVVTFAGKRVFSTLQGVYGESSSRVARGTIKSGYVDYNLADDKTALRIATKHGPGEGSYAVSLAVDDSTPRALGPAVQTVGTSSGGAVLATNMKGSLFEVTFDLIRSTGDITAGPVLRRWTLRSSVAVPRGRIVTVPLLLYDTIVDVTGANQHMDPSAAREAIAALASTGQVVTYQEADEAYSVIVMDYHWVADHLQPRPKTWNGTLSTILYFL